MEQFGMKFSSFLMILYLFTWKFDNSSAAIGNFEIKNFVLFYGAANVTKDEMNNLVNLIASPVIANTTEDPDAAMFDSKTVILNYTIVNIAQPDNFTDIPVKKNHTIEYFRNLLQQYNNTNKYRKFSLKKLQIFLQKCPPFSGISVITNLIPEDSNILPEILQLIKKKSLQVVVSPFDNSTIKSNYVGYRYFHPNDPVAEDYQQINKAKYDLDGESYIKKTLNKYVYLNAKNDSQDTSIVIIFDWFSLIQLSINSNLQYALNLFLEKLYKYRQIFSYQDHNVRIKKLYLISSDMANPEPPVEEIDVSKRHDLEYLDELIAKLANSNDTSRFSMKSLVKGLELSLPNGIIFVFAGTQPQDSELMPNILKLMDDKKITVEIAYMKTKKYKQPDIEYQQINEASYKNHPIPT